LTELTGTKSFFTRKITKSLGIGVAVFAFLALLILIPTIGNEGYRQRLPFDSVAWKRRAYDSDANFMWPTRKRMVDDLQQSGILQSKSRAEVIALLGEPDNSLSASKDGITYVLGPERGYGVDYEWLQIHFDSKGHVREVNTTTD
jgi:hypothetical protein